MNYYQYLKYHIQDGSSKSLRHLTVIEEAHRLFKSVSSERTANHDGSISSNPTGQLVDMLGNIMAEIRAFGEGLLIVDQSPSKVADDVIKNSATKIVHRIDNVKDMKLLQSALLLRDNESNLPSLTQGEALIRTDGMSRPCKVKIYLSDRKENYKLSTTFCSDGTVKEAITPKIISEINISANVKPCFFIKPPFIKCVLLLTFYPKCDYILNLIIWQYF